MSYSIIFQTKIAKLKDGRIIHFDRSGCNNDNAGRNKGNFSGKVYTIEEFIAYAEAFKKDSIPYKESGEFDMKIVSRPASFYDYGEHLLRMLKRSKTLDEIMRSKCFRASYCKAIEIVEPAREVIKPENFLNRIYNLEGNTSSIRYRRIMEHLLTEKEIVQSLENGKEVEFFIL